MPSTEITRPHYRRNEAADNVLDRQFEATAPNQKWIADFTYM